MIKKIETRRLTGSRSNGIMAFNKKDLEDCNFVIGTDYNVLYEDDRITIVKELKIVEIRDKN